MAEVTASLPASRSGRSSALPRIVGEKTRLRPRGAISWGPSRAYLRIDRPRTGGPTSMRTPPHPGPVPGHEHGHAFSSLNPLEREGLVVAGRRNMLKAG